MTRRQAARNINKDILLIDAGDVFARVCECIEDRS